MVTRVVTLTAVLLAGTAQAAQQDAAASGSARVADGTALERIDRAFLEGRVDRAEHTLLAYRLLRDARSLPVEFRPAEGEAPLRCGTLIARRAWQMARDGVFDEGQMAQFAALGGRPSLPNNQVVMDGASNIIATLHWPDTVTQGEADAVMAFIAQTWQAEFVTMGWRPPPSDGGSGGGDELDIYLDPTAQGAYTQPDLDGPEAWADAASYVVIDPSVPNIETYVAHEVNHASQFAYDSVEGDFIYEATATWMEDQVYDSVNDYTFFVPDFQDEPAETLSYATYSNSYMYGGAVFFHYLNDVYGGTTVRDVWDASKQNSGSNSVDWFDGVMTALGGQGFADIAEVYAEFAGYRFLTGANAEGSLDEGSAIQRVKIEQVYNSIEAGSGETTDPPFGMGANYIMITAADAEEGDAITIKVDSGEPGPWYVTTIARQTGGSATITVFPDDDGDGTVEAEVPDVTSYDIIGFAITNASNASEGVDSTFGSSVSRTPHPFSWSFGKKNDAVGCGCRIPAGARPMSAGSVLGALLLGAGVVALRRRERSPFGPSEA